MLIKEKQNIAVHFILLMIAVLGKVGGGSYSRIIQIGLTESLTESGKSLCGIVNIRLIYEAV